MDCNGSTQYGRSNLTHSQCKSPLEDGEIVYDRRAAKFHGYDDADYCSNAPDRNSPSKKIARPGRKDAVVIDLTSPQPEASSIPRLDVQRAENKVAHERNLAELRKKIYYSCGDVPEACESLASSNSIVLPGFGNPVHVKPVENALDDDENKKQPAADAMTSICDSHEHSTPTQRASTMRTSPAINGSVAGIEVAVLTSKQLQNRKEEHGTSGRAKGRAVQPTASSVSSKAASTAASLDSGAKSALQRQPEHCEYHQSNDAARPRSRSRVAKVTPAKKTIERRRDPRKGQRSDGNTCTSRANSPAIQEAASSADIQSAARLQQNKSVKSPKKSEPQTQKTGNPSSCRLFSMGPPPRASPKEDRSTTKKTDHERDVELWLRITGFDDKRFREDTLQNHNLRTQLEDRKRALEQEFAELEAKEAAAATTAPQDQVIGRYLRAQSLSRVTGTPTPPPMIFQPHNHALAGTDYVAAAKHKMDSSDVRIKRFLSRGSDVQEYQHITKASRLGTNDRSADADTGQGGGPAHTSPNGGTRSASWDQRHDTSNNDNNNHQTPNHKLSPKPPPSSSVGLGSQQQQQRVHTIQDPAKKPDSEMSAGDCRGRRHRDSLENADSVIPIEWRRRANPPTAARNNNRGDARIYRNSWDGKSGRRASASSSSSFSLWERGDRWKPT